MPATKLAINGVTYYDLTVTAFDKLADLRTYPLSNNPNWTKRAIVNVFGSASFNDGNFFIYAWVPESVAADSAPSVIQPTAITGAGRWVLMAWNNGGVAIVGFKTGFENPNDTGVVGDAVGQRYFRTNGDCAVYYWNGSAWCN